MTGRPFLVTDPALARAPYAHAAVARFDEVLVFTAGACPLDTSGHVVGDTVAAQAEQAMDNLEIALSGAGSDLARVVRTTVHVATADRAELVQAWDVVHDRFGEHEPAASLIGVTVLGHPGQCVEIEAVAIVP